MRTITDGRVAWIGWRSSSVFEAGGARSSRHAGSSGGLATTECGSLAFGECGSLAVRLPAPELAEDQASALRCSAWVDRRHTPLTFRRRDRGAGTAAVSLVPAPEVGGASPRVSTPVDDFQMQIQLVNATRPTKPPRLVRSPQPSCSKEIFRQRTTSGAGTLAQRDFRTRRNGQRQNSELSCVPGIDSSGHR